MSEAPRAKFEASFSLGQKVLIDDEIRGRVICVSFRADAMPQYEVAWCNGDKIEEHWVYEWRIRSVQ